MTIEQDRKAGQSSHSAEWINGYAAKRVVGDGYTGHSVVWVDNYTTEGVSGQP